MKDLYVLFRQGLAGFRLLARRDCLLLGVVSPLVVNGLAPGRRLPGRPTAPLGTTPVPRSPSTDAVVRSCFSASPIEAAPPRLFQAGPRTAVDATTVSRGAGSNLGPKNTRPVRADPRDQAEVADARRVSSADVPPRRLTASASGLDWEISVAYAELQVPRGAVRQGLRSPEVRGLVDRRREGADPRACSANPVDVLVTEP